MHELLQLMSTMLALLRIIRILSNPGLVVTTCLRANKFGTSVLNKVVRWRSLGEVENVHVAYNLSHFAIFLPNFIKIGENLTKF